MPRHGLAEDRAEAPQAPEAPAPKAGRRGGLASWPIRRKLGALAALPLLVITGAGAYITKLSYDDITAAGQVVSYAQAAQRTTALTTALAQEELASRTWLSLQSGKDQVDAARKQTDAALTELNSALASPPSGGWSSGVTSAISDLGERQRQIGNLRTSIDGKKLTAGPELSQRFDGPLLNTRTLTTALARDLSSSALDGFTIESATVLNALAGAAEQATSEGAQLSQVLEENRVSDYYANLLREVQAKQVNLIDIAEVHATEAQRTQIETIKATDTTIASFRDEALALQTKPAADATEADQRQAAQFRDQEAKRLTAYNTVTQSIADDVAAHADTLRQNAIVRTALALGLALASIGIVSLFAAAVTRTVTGPMRRLRTGAVDAATVRLPAAVRQIEREGPEAAVAIPPVLPPEIAAGPEVREVATALDGLTSETVRLATSQVRLRQALDEAFVSMSRRSQSMVEKQLAIIDELESTEEDPEQLRNLFRLDHLAARMRRYNDNLLVLAGSSVRTRSAAPVPIADVFRAATSEMEQYERVRLQPLSGASVAGASAGGLIHLLAELLDNAAMYSPPTSPITLAAAFTPDGGLLLEVTDSGVGIPPAELAELNARLAMPGSIDTQVPSRMGLYVVARLAQRGGFGVRLSTRPGTSGTVAEVGVPSSLVIGAPTGPIETVPGSAAPVEPPRLLPAQHGVTATPLRGISRASGRSGSPAAPSSPAPSSPAPPTAPLSPTAPAAPAAPAAPLSPAAPVAPAAAGAGRGSADAPGQLPSRRPGAALAGNPLAAAAAAAAPAPTAPAGAPGAPGAPAVPDAPAARAGQPGARSPFDSPVPWTDRPQPAGNGAAAGIAAGRRLGAVQGGPAGGAATGQAPADGAPGIPSISAAPSGDTLPRRERGATPEATPFGVTSTTGPGAFDPPPGRRSVPATEARTMPPNTPGDRSAGRPAIVRSPGEPGGAPPIGPSAATAAAAAASARTRPAGPPPTSGLFAPTGPATGPLVQGRGTGSPAEGPQDATGDAPAPGSASNGAAAGPGTPSGTPSWVRTSPSTGPATGAAALPPATPSGLPIRVAGASAPPPPTAPVQPPAGLNIPAGPVPPAPAPALPKRGENPAGTASSAPSSAPAPAPAPSTTPPPIPPVEAKDGGVGTAGTATDRGTPAPAAPAGPASTRAARWPAFGSPGAPSGPRTGSQPAQTQAMSTAPAASAPAAPVDPTPMELAARQAVAASSPAYRPVAPSGPASAAGTGERMQTPIFDSISVWFADDRTAPATARAGEPARVIDLRDPSTRGAATPSAPSGAPAGTGPSGSAAPAASPTSTRWSALGDQRWIATNARAASRPETAGETGVGLPRRRPGANLLPSAAAAASPQPAGVSGSSPAPRRTDAESVRGRLGSYQRGLSSARRARHLPPDAESGGLFSAPPGVGEPEAGRRSGGQGGDS